MISGEAAAADAEEEDIVRPRREDWMMRRETLIIACALDPQVTRILAEEDSVPGVVHQLCQEESILIGNGGSAAAADLLITSMY
jgi:hypothetical protein